MQVAVTADFHGQLPRATPECDLLLLAGDVLPAGGFSSMSTRSASRPFGGEMQVFADWLLAQPAKVIVGIAGNHDFVADDQPEIVRRLPWVYLQDEEVTIDIAGKPTKIWGSPRSNRFNDWAFVNDETELQAVWATIPDDVEILMTHGPAQGILDRVGDRNAGSITLRERLRELKHLKLFAFGHIHESYGLTTFARAGVKDAIGWVQCVNGAYLNGHFQPGNQPIMVTL